jgi:hypothetical protein
MATQESVSGPVPCLQTVLAVAITLGNFTFTGMRQESHGVGHALGPVRAGL